MSVESSGVTATPTPSARQVELLEAAYRYVLAHGLTDLSLRPLAAAIGSSTRVLTFLFGNKDGLVRALLARARADELALLADLENELPHHPPPGDTRLAEVADRLWTWLSAPEHRALLTLWLEAYTRSLLDPDGPWSGFARATVTDWLTLLSRAQPAHLRDTPEAAAHRTHHLALLRGALLDLLATGDTARVTAAVRME